MKDKILFFFEFSELPNTTALVKPQTGKKFH